jgi:CDP-glycerol glycerophosphotransferase (TagB/SpsB family)
VAALTDTYNLIVKPHPNIFNANRPFFDPFLVIRLENTPGIRLIRAGNVMPWFAQADLFIGDISAAGYEWLYFNRPMVFLNPRPGELRADPDVHGLTYLWQCGEVCDDIADLESSVEVALAADSHSVRREAVLHYSFHQPRDGRAVERGIAAIEALLDNEDRIPRVHRG